MVNTTLASKEQLTFIDKTVYSPKTADLVARSIFSSIKVGQADVAYRYKVKSFRGMAKEYTNRATDIPVVDENITETQTPITQFSVAAQYSWLELLQAQAANVDLLADQAQTVARVMGEKEDRLVFNGSDNSDPNMKIIGLTNKASDAGFQEAKPDQTFAQMDGMALRKFFKEAVGKITHLVGYASAKPVLMLPQDELDILDQPFNEYRPDMTVLSMIQPWFSSIQPVAELEGQYWHHKNASATDKKKDMGIIAVNTPDVAQIVDAMPITRMQQEASHLKTTIPYVERMGGLAVRYPSAIVQLNNIN